MRKASRFEELDDFSNLLLLMFKKVRQLMKVPYGYVIRYNKFRKLKSR